MCWDVPSTFRQAVESSASALLSCLWRALKPATGESLGPPWVFPAMCTALHVALILSTMLELCQPCMDISLPASGNIDERSERRPEQIEKLCLRRSHCDRGRPRRMLSEHRILKVGIRECVVLKDNSVLHVVVLLVVEE